MGIQNWTNHFRFIITVSSFTIGVGKIWQFPYLECEGGGKAFLKGIPIMLAGISLGPMAQPSSLVGIGKLSGKKVHIDALAECRFNSQLNKLIRLYE